MLGLLVQVTFLAVVAIAGAGSVAGTATGQHDASKVGGVEFFVFLGQSNMDNAWGNQPRFRSPSPQVQIWRDGKWQPYDPNRNASNQYPMVYGPEIEFLYQWLGANPSKSAYLIKQATGGTSLAVHWRQDGTGTQWNALASQYRATKTAGLDLPAPTVFIMQGEADSMNYAFASAYQVNFSALFTSLRALFGSSTRIIVGRVDTEIANRGYLWAKTIQQAQHNVVKADGNARLVSTDCVELDPPPSPHFTKAVGIPHLGSLFYKGYAGIAAVQMPPL